MSSEAQPVEAGATRMQNKSSVCAVLVPMATSGLFKGECACATHLDSLSRLPEAGSCTEVDRAEVRTYATRASDVVPEHMRFVDTRPMRLSKEELCTVTVT